MDDWDGLDVETKTLEDWTFWLTNGDWHLDPQGGGVDTFVLEGLDVGTEELVEGWVFTTGDWHLDAQGGVWGEVAVDDWGGLDAENEEPVEGLLFWVPIGDWHLTPQGGERGEGDVEVWEAGIGEMIADWLTTGD